MSIIYNALSKTVAKLQPIMKTRYHLNDGIAIYFVNCFLTPLHGYFFFIVVPKYFIRTSWCSSPLGEIIQTWLLYHIKFHNNFPSYTAYLKCWLILVALSLNSLLGFLRLLCEFVIHISNVFHFLSIEWLTHGQNNSLPTLLTFKIVWDLTSEILSIHFPFISLKYMTKK